MSLSPRRVRRCAAALGTGVALLLAAGCGDFSSAPPSWSVQPSLTAPAATPVVPTPTLPGSTTTPPSGSGGSTSSSTTGPPPDPCRPPDPSVIAACLKDPWGLVPLADGMSALVGERTTGRILLAVYQRPPVLLATVPGVDGTGDGGLLGLAVSPSYAEDGLVYAFVTTATDNRVVRIARGEKPKAILTGIPKGRTHNGGVLAFNGPYLFVATGDAGRPTLAGDARSLAGKVLRLDEFGKPVGGTLTPGSPVFATGFTAPTGMCRLPTGALAVVDHRATADVLLPLSAGKSYTRLASGDAAWTWRASDGGAADCASTNGVLASTSLDRQRLTGIRMTPTGAFTGSPEALLERRYGRLRTVEAGPRNLFWVTTANRDGHGRPVASDDRVVVVPSGGGGGGGGPD
ncbi:PQQ-dependent sugar dehydrogenase [Nakamurella endophytica]|uniref:Glucose dehydrogenase n=1 Tax=Nakamurella endophytica TaxID=1748367 RepID=A0A917SJI7_9ACTN|nr:PQQ-dependent sugar dehydrogenase [Nakamurella endophytica]GGL85091.1 glucose dehydrogenase [Nakamurella endophytica]